MARAFEAADIGRAHTQSMVTPIDNRRTDPATGEDVARLCSEVRLGFGILFALHLVVLGIVATTPLLLL